jgi:hypothetical protein
MRFIDEHRHDMIDGREFGVEPICRVLSEHRCQIAPSTYDAAKNRPLCADRAATVKPDFVVTSENTAAVAGVVRRLDGIALAIELAAARIAVIRRALEAALGTPADRWCAVRAPSWLSWLGRPRCRGCAPSGGTSHRRSATECGCPR